MVEGHITDTMKTIAGLALMVALVVPVAAQTTYTITDLGVLRGGSARVHAINSRAEVVGGSGFVYGTDRHAFYWKAGGLHDLGGFGDISEAYSINDAGLVVGSSNAGDTIKGFTWTSTGTLHELSALPGTNSSQAYAVNAQGDIAGASGTHAVVWKQGNIVDLGALPEGDWSEAHGINNLGQVVGISSSAEGNQAFLWSRGAMKGLGVLPGDESSRANLINDQGLVIGASEGRNGVHAFIWSAKLGMQPIDTTPGSIYSEAFGINNVGQVVGISGSSIGTRAMLWTSPTEMVDLNTLVDGPPTLVLTGAFAINDKGQIVAFGINEPNLSRTQESHDDAHIHHAGTHVFLLTPQ